MIQSENDIPNLINEQEEEKEESVGVASMSNVSILSTKSNMKLDGSQTKYVCFVYGMAMNEPFRITYRTTTESEVGFYCCKEPCAGNAPMDVKDKGRDKIFQNEIRTDLSKYIR